MGKRFFISIYLWVLSCFPKTYREEYQEELEYAVFALTEEGSAKGKWSLIRLAFRELRDLPFALVLAHVRVIRGKIMKMKPGFYLPDSSLNGWKLAAVFLPFVFPLFVLPAVIGIPILAGTFLFKLAEILGWLLIGALVAVWLAGVISGFPTWSLPGLGLIVAFIGFCVRFLVYAFVLMMKSFLPLGAWTESKAGAIFFYAVRDLNFLILMGIILIVVLRKEDGFRQRVCQDWSLLSFLLYTMAIPTVLVIDEYRGLENYQVTCTLILAAGAWLFLVLPKRKHRLMALLLPVILSASIMSLGIYNVIPIQTFAWRIESILWESIQHFLNTLALVILLCLPILIPRTPLVGKTKLVDGV
ncbi:MAG: hypothetical protein EHM41_18860 [Chloroflexi bacterium]|nr:MAG: hypothetical protein EHM41_18860 [Chloroflexota bacterium]